MTVSYSVIGGSPVYAVDPVHGAVVSVVDPSLDKVEVGRGGSSEIEGDVIGGV